jgi:hypothetical protein
MLRANNRAHRLDVRQIGASMRGGQQAFDLMGLDVFTLPTKVAEEYRDLDPAAAEVRDRTNDDPRVSLAAGRDIRHERLDCLWEISPAMREAVDAIVAGDPDRMSGDDLRRTLRSHGVGDLFGDMSADDRAANAADGKIPVYERWKDRVQAGTASWDGLLTEAALASFATDQSKLDARIREHLAP